MDVQRRLQAKRRSVNRAVKDLRAEVDLEDDSSVSSDMEEYSGAAVPVDGLDTPSEFTQSRILAVGDDLSLESDISTSCGTRFDFNDQQGSNSEESCHSSDTYSHVTPEPRNASSSRLQLRTCSVKHKLSHQAISLRF